MPAIPGDVFQDALANLARARVIPPGWGQSPVEAYYDGLMAEPARSQVPLYRRLSELTEDGEIRGFAAELTDRFGPLPEEVEHLLKIVAIKGLCRRANVEKIDAGPKGAVVAFRDNVFANPDGLVAWLARDVKDGSAKLRPDMKLVFRRDWDQPEDRLKGATTLLRQMVKIAEAGAKAAA